MSGSSLQRAVHYSETTAAVFVMGSPRSGTSAMSWALAQHPEFETGPEAAFPFFLCDHGAVDHTWEVSHARTDGWLVYHDVELSEYLGWLGVGVDQLFLSRGTGKRWIDSTPNNVLVVKTLAQMFPNARFVHLVRDGRAVVSSLLRSGFDYAPARSFRLAAKTWAQHVSAGLAAANELPDRVLQIRHEHVESEPEVVLAQVQEFLQVEPHDEPAAFLRANRINSSYGNGTAADPSTIERPRTPWVEWRAPQRWWFRYYGGALMRQLGYGAGR